MPRTTRQYTTEQQAERRTRVSSYQARIERTLTEHYQEVPTGTQSGDWQLFAVAHTRGHAVCELCGHNPIRRLFFIRNRTTAQELMIGSECARNYVAVNLVEAYQRSMVRAANRRRQQRDRAAVRQAYAGPTETPAPETPESSWLSQNMPMVAFLNDLPASLRTNDFLRSISESLVQYRHLTPRQTAAVQRFMDFERTRSSTATPTVPVGRGAEIDPARVAPATSSDLPQIFNGIYTLDSGGQHLTYKIQTIMSGNLRGKRVIKRLVGGGDYKGFAFLNVNGGLNLWQSANPDASSLYVAWARQLLTILNTAEAQTAMRTGDTAFYATTTDGRRVNVTLSTFCRCCNRQLTTPTSVERGIGPECESRENGTDRTVAARPTARADASAIAGQENYVVTPSGRSVPRRRVSNPVPTSTRGSRQDSIWPAASQLSSAPAPRQLQLALSQLGTGEVL